MAQYKIDNQPEPVNFEIGDDPVARTIQNCKNLLMTKMGEVPYDRYRGFDYALYHLPIDKMRSALLPELAAHVPGADVLVAGSDVFGAPDRAARIRELRGDRT